MASNNSMIEHFDLNSGDAETFSLRQLLGKHVYFSVVLVCHLRCVLTHFLKALAHVVFVSVVFMGCALLMDPKSTIASQVCCFVGAASGALIDFLLELLLNRSQTTLFATELADNAPPVSEGFLLSIGVGELRRQIDNGFVVAPEGDEPVPRCIDLDAFVDDINSIEDHAWVDTADVIVDDPSESSGTFPSATQNDPPQNNGFQTIEHVVVHHVEVPFLQNSIIITITIAVLIAILLLEVTKIARPASIVTSFQLCLFFWDLLLIQSLSLAVRYVGYFMLDIPLHAHPHPGQFIQLATHQKNDQPVP